MCVFAGQYDIANSVTAFELWGGVSGGTLSSFITLLEQVPPEKRREANVDFALSPGGFVVSVVGSLGIINFLSECS